MLGCCQLFFCHHLFGLAGDHLSFRFGMLVFGASVILLSGLVYFLTIPTVREGPLHS